MCVLIKNKKPLVATEDITCYKTFRAKKNDTEAYYPLWRVVKDFSYHIGEIKEEENIEADIIECKFHPSLYETRTGFYSYKELNPGWINHLYNLFNLFKNDNIQTFKCIIPKGSLYYSETGSYGTELVSNKIMLKELVDKDILRQVLISNIKQMLSDNNDKPYVITRCQEDDTKGGESN